MMWWHVEPVLRRFFHFLIQVEAYLNSAKFAAKQAARKASGGRGIIINAGGPQLISSTIVTLKVRLAKPACLGGIVVPADFIVTSFQCPARLLQP